MSKNITIQEGGVAKQLTVDKLKTNVVGGGTCLWVPEDETRLGTKQITENGTYKASDDGYYGYSQVTVSGVGTATGKDPTTGKTSTVTTDPTTGELVTTVIPMSIGITTPPTFIGPYSDGVRISFDGLVVHLYDSDGEDMGVVPVGELTFPVTVARYSSGSETYEEITTDLDLSPLNQPIATVQSASYKFNLDQYVHTNTYDANCKMAIFQAPDGNCWIIAASDQAGKRIRKTSSQPNWEQDHYTYTSVNTTVNKGEKIAYTTWIGIGSIPDGAYDVSGFDRNSMSGNITGTSVLNDAAWAMIYGSISMAGGMSVPVQYQRPGDGAILETSFNITVEQSYGGATGGGGQAGDTGAGRND